MLISGESSLLLISCLPSVPGSGPMDDGAFEASQVLLQSTTPDVFRTPWLHTIQSNKPVVRLEEAAADREHQLLLPSRTVMAESLRVAPRLGGDFCLI